MKKIWKSRAYRDTKVDSSKTESDIGKLLKKYGINERQFTDRGDKAEFTFLKDMKVETGIVKVGVKIVIPNITDKNRNQLYRALFYYLKAKFESLDFGFVEEHQEAFVKEFLPYLIVDKSGRTVTDLIIPKLHEAMRSSVEGEQLFLENKTGVD